MTLREMALSERWKRTATSCSVAMCSSGAAAAMRARIWLNTAFGAGVEYLSYRHIRRRRSKSAKLMA